MKETRKKRGRKEGGVIHSSPGTAHGRPGLAGGAPLAGGQVQGGSGWGGLCQRESEEALHYSELLNPLLNPSAK